MTNNYTDSNTKKPKKYSLDIFGNPMGFNTDNTTDLPTEDSTDLTAWEKINRWATVDTSKFNKLSPHVPEDFDNPWEDNG